jgi:FkbH-like protein
MATKNVKSKKCVVWDLDNTVWDGICLEGNVYPRAEVKKTIVELDNRGILHSIASRGDEDVAVDVLKRHDLFKYFLVPKINWLPKNSNIISIVDELGISVDSIVFIDDDVFELEQIRYMIPEVVTIAAGKASDLPEMPIFNPSTFTRESKHRRQFYQAEQHRKL